MKKTMQNEERNRTLHEVRQHADIVLGSITEVSRCTTLAGLLQAGDQMLKKSRFCGPKLFASIWSLEQNDLLGNQILDVCVQVMSWVQPTREQGLTEDAEVVARFAQTLKYYADACSSRADWEEQNRMAIEQCREVAE